MRFCEERELPVCKGSIAFDNRIIYLYTQNSNSKEETVMIVAIIGLIIWVLSLIGNIKVAQAKNRRVGVWVVLSVFFSWIALIINAVLPAKEPKGE